MIKSEVPLMQALYQTTEVEVVAERRSALARKGQVLYGKYCGTGGQGICAESFAEYHIWRGEYAVARDLLVYLSEQVSALRQMTALDPGQQKRLTMTEGLISRIEAHLGNENLLEPQLALEISLSDG